MENNNKTQVLNENITESQKCYAWMLRTYSLAYRDDIDGQLVNEAWIVYRVNMFNLIQSELNGGF